MAFRFSLATVLHYRESVEKREELALQKILQEMARIRRDIQRLTTEIVDAQATRNKAMLQPVVAIHLQMMTRAIDGVAERKKALIASLNALEQERLKQMKKYQVAHRDRQMLSDMRVRQREAYEQERARTEQKFLDDIFAARAQRN